MSDADKCCIEELTFTEEVGYCNAYGHHWLCALDCARRGFSERCGDVGG